MPRKESGQVLVLLILIMTVALATGLSIVQKSLSDISTASRVEQSSRAFSAAEAGIEKALLASEQLSEPDSNFNISETNSSVLVSDPGLQPARTVPGSQQEPLEFPPLAKEDVVQVWLAGFDSQNNPPEGFYTQDSLDVYWGNSGSDKAALEVTLVYYEDKYKTKQWFFDHPASGRENGFDKEDLDCGGRHTLLQNTYQCKKTITGFSSGLPMLIRARLLYNNTSQPFAVQATGTCGAEACNIPPQARTIESTGTSGETRRKIRVFQIDDVVPNIFDYVIFSAGKITK